MSFTIFSERNVFIGSHCWSSESFIFQSAQTTYQIGVLTPQKYGGGSLSGRDILVSKIKGGVDKGWRSEYNIFFLA